MATDAELRDGEGVWYDTDPNTGCWIWQRCLLQSGYGQVRTGGKRERAHRRMYTVFHGEVPEGMHVLHRCNTPACVNPEHLYVGTHQDNMQDASPLTEKGTQDARYMRSCGYTLKQIGDVLGVHLSTIGKITTDVNWRTT